MTHAADIIGRLRERQAVRVETEKLKEECWIRNEVWAERCRDTESRAQSAEAEVARYRKALEEITSGFSGIDPGPIDSDDRDVLWSRVARRRRDIARAALAEGKG